MIQNLNSSESSSGDDLREIQQKMGALKTLVGMETKPDPELLLSSSSSSIDSAQLESQALHGKKMKVENPRLEAVFNLSKVE